MLERRKHPRKTVDLPVTISLSPSHPKNGRMADISVEGMMFLCVDKPETSSEVELRFTLPFFHISPDLKIAADITHVVEAHVTPCSTQPDYHYMVGVKFKKLQENDRAILNQFMKNDTASDRFE